MNCEKRESSMADVCTTADRIAERALVTRARSGDAEALRILIESHKDRLFGFIWRMIRNHHDAEELCQDAFLKAFASLDSFRVEYRFSTWLFTIGYRLCLNRLRRRNVLAELNVASVSLAEPDGTDEALESEEAAALRETVWNAVDQLSAPQRAAVLLFYRHGMGCEEIARVVEMPVATVKSHLHRARHRLRQLLEALDQKKLDRLRNFARLSG